MERLINKEEEEEERAQYMESLINKEEEEGLAVR